MKSLLVAGMILFLIGLLSGLFIPYFENAHMGQTAHLVGVQNSIVLIVFGLTLNYISLSTMFLNLFIILSVYSMYAIWLSVALAGFSNVNSNTSIANEGITASNMLLYSGSLAIIIATLLIIIWLMHEKF